MMLDDSSDSFARSTFFALGDGGRSARERLLLAHIDRLWQKLPEQSRQRLGCVGASTGLAVDAEDHLAMLGAFELIADDEGVLEVESHFARYLALPWVCEAVAESQRPPPSERRREQNRLAAAKFRQKHKRAEERRRQAKTDRVALRMEDTLSRRAIMIDGEGVTLESGEHLYRYMAACLSDGTLLGELEDEGGIKTASALDFIASLPKVDTKTGKPFLGIFGYGLGYDMCKWLEQMKNSMLFKLMHNEDLKPDAKYPPFVLMLLGKCFQLDHKRMPKGARRTLVWDIIKGFQSSFVNALKAWEVGTKEEHARIVDMKNQRGNFRDVSWAEVKRYCRDECRLGAQLVEKYIYAHVEAGIDLKGKYHGAGSTSDAFLGMMGALEKRCTRAVEEEDLLAYRDSRSAFSRAFFGGRAEVSRLGVVRMSRGKPGSTSDVASAYPHALYLLPCVKHGKWRRITEKGVGRAVAASRLCCVRFVVEPRAEHLEFGSKKNPEVTKRQANFGIGGDTSPVAWGPLPYRTKAGSIVFPSVHPGGWAWGPEYQVAKRHFEAVRGKEAWALRSECQCSPPYEAIGMYYQIRIEWGSSARGKVLKLGMNGCYGKICQVIGKNPKYACRAVAGHITASTRARIAEAIYTAADPWSVFYVATDGIIADTPLSPPNPAENETRAAAAKRGKAMLGEWEVEPLCQDYFVVQPGYYFTLGGRLKREVKLRTRGVPANVIVDFDPRSDEVIVDRRADLVAQWMRHPLREPTGLGERSVFRGIKTSILKPTARRSKYVRKPCYGRWEVEPRVQKYIINPKRSDAIDLGDGGMRLSTWWLDPFGPESAEYKKDMAAAAAQDELDEQPDHVEGWNEAGGD